MSYLGNKRKTYVFTSITPLVDDKDVPNSMQTALSRYIKFGGDLPKQLMEAKQYSMPTKMKRINKWVGDDIVHYAYGAVKSVYVEHDMAVVGTYLQTYLSTLVGHTVTKLYTRFGGINNYHAVWDKLINIYDYDPSTNILGTLTTSVGTNCYFYDAQIDYINDTVDKVLDITFLDPLPNSVAFTSGATQSRSQDLGRAHTAYTTHGSFASSFGTASNKDLLTLQYTYRRVSTRTEVFNDTLATTVSDTTVSDVSTPTGYDSVSSSVYSTTSNTVSVLFSTPPDVFHSIRTVVTVTHYEYIFSIDTDFLEYEPSGYLDENVYLGDTNTIDPTAEGDLSGITAGTGKYIECYYTYNDGTDKQAYLTYLYGSGTNTDLDNIFNTSAEVGSFYPRIYMRMGGVDLTDSSFEGTPAYVSSVKIGKRLGLDWKGLSKQIHESIGELADVSQILLTALAPLNTLKAPLIQYLLRWFKAQYDLMDPTVIVPDWTDGTDMTSYYIRGGQGIEFKDQVYRQSFGFKAIGHRVVTGSIGVVGTATNTYSRRRHKYQVQTTATEYEEILVFSAESREDVLLGMSTISGSNSAELAVAMDMDIVNTFPNALRETIINQGMHIIVNTVKIVKIPWYTSGIFKAVLFVIAVILAIPSGGTSLTAFAIFEAIAIVVLETLIIQAVARVLVNVFNIDVGVASAIIAVVALLAGGYAKFDGSTVFSLTAKELLQVTNIAFKLSQEGFKLQAENLADEQESFMSMTEIKQAELDAAKALITKVHSMKDYLLMPTNMSKEFYVLGESPTDYYNRTVHSGNVGALLPTLLSASSELLLVPPSMTQSLNQVMKR